MFPKCGLALTAALAVAVTLYSKPAYCGDDSMSASEMQDIVDDLGGPKAEAAPAQEHEEDGIDREMSEAGGSDGGSFERSNTGHTPEPIVTKDAFVHGGDPYNKTSEHAVARKPAKKSSHSKTAKHSKKLKRTRIVKYKHHQKPVHHKVAKHKAKRKSTKDRRVARSHNSEFR